jgi:hypothetical protein
MTAALEFLAGGLALDGRDAGCTGCETGRLCARRAAAAAGGEG